MTAGTIESDLLTGIVRTATLRFALLGGMALSACSSGGPIIQSSPVPATLPVANQADVDFLRGMIHHHAQAITMAEWSSDHGASESIQTLSGRIVVSQRDEIALMQLWLHDHGRAAPEVTPAGNVVSADGMNHADVMMPGMLTPDQMDQLDRARGSAFDRLFLTYMIQHHVGALQMVETLFASDGGAADDSVYKFASDTFADQGSEIDRMERMLTAMAGTDPR